MKKYTCMSKTFLTLFMLTLSSCRGIFILDPIDPRLPKYTEKGNNVAGAFVNDKVWESIVSYSFLLPEFDKPRIIGYEANDSMVIRFEGDVLSLPTTIEFHLTGLNIHKFDDLILLKDKKIQLDGLKNAAFISDKYDSDYPATRGTGQIYFRHVTVDDVTGKAILSGTFGFSIKNTLSGITEVTYGRFDYKFDKYTNFLINK
jgi:hypothetical protein